MCWCVQLRPRNLIGVLISWNPVTPTYSSGYQPAGFHRKLFCDFRDVGSVRVLRFLHSLSASTESINSGMTVFSWMVLECIPMGASIVASFTLLIFLIASILQVRSASACALKRAIYIYSLVLGRCV